MEQHVASVVGNLVQRMLDEEIEAVRVEALATASASPDAVSTSDIEAAIRDAMASRVARELPLWGTGQPLVLAMAIRRLTDAEFGRLPLALIKTDYAGDPFRNLVYAVQDILQGRV